MNDYDDIDDQDLPKSKSQVKREMTELQKLGERLVSLSPQQLKKVKLPHELIEAINSAKKISSHGAKRRQLQYIGRLMRLLEDPEHIRDFLQEIEARHQKANAYFHMLEAWRERLIGEDGQALTEFFNLYPSAERQYLRQLVQNAKKERAQGQSGNASRQLFRYLKELHQTKSEE